MLLIKSRPRCVAAGISIALVVLVAGTSVAAPRSTAWKPSEAAKVSAATIRYAWARSGTHEDILHFYAPLWSKSTAPEWRTADDWMKSNLSRLNDDLREPCVTPTPPKTAADPAYATKRRVCYLRNVMVDVEIAAGDPTPLPSSDTDRHQVLLYQIPYASLDADAKALLNTAPSPEAFYGTWPATLLVEVGSTIYWELGGSPALELDTLKGQAGWWNCKFGNTGGCDGAMGIENPSMNVQRTILFRAPWFSGRNAEWQNPWRKKLSGLIGLLNNYAAAIHFSQARLIHANRGPIDLDSVRDLARVLPVAIKSKSDEVFDDEEYQLGLVTVGVAPDDDGPVLAINLNTTAISHAVLDKLSLLLQDWADWDKEDDGTAFGFGARGYRIADLLAGPGMPHAKVFPAMVTGLVDEGSFGKEAVRWGITTATAAGAAATGDVHSARDVATATAKDVGTTIGLEVVGSFSGGGGPGWQAKVRAAMIDRGWSEYVANTVVFGLDSVKGITTGAVMGGLLGWWTGGIPGIIVGAITGAKGAAVAAPVRRTGDLVMLGWQNYTALPQVFVRTWDTATETVSVLDDRYRGDLRKKLEKAASAAPEHPRNDADHLLSRWVFPFVRWQHHIAIASLPAADREAFRTRLDTALATYVTAVTAATASGDATAQMNAVDAALVQWSRDVRLWEQL